VRKAYQGSHAVSAAKGTAQSKGGRFASHKRIKMPPWHACRLKEERSERAASDTLLARHRASAAEVAPQLAGAAAALQVPRSVGHDVQDHRVSAAEGALQMPCFVRAWHFQQRSNQPLLTYD
jgi:hypothetical protein